MTGNNITETHGPALGMTVAAAAQIVMIVVVVEMTGVGAEVEGGGGGGEARMIALQDLVIQDGLVGRGTTAYLALTYLDDGRQYHCSLLLLRIPRYLNSSLLLTLPIT